MLFRVSFKTLKNEVKTSKFLLCMLVAFFVFNNTFKTKRRRKDETISRFNNTVVKTRDREDNHLEGNLFRVIIICSKHDFFSFLQIIFIVVVVFPVIFQ